MSGWIKIHRSILDWEWYEDTNTFRLFIHLILKANHKDKNYKGKLIKRGCLVTGRDLLSIETGLSVQQIRMCLERLKSTNEITIKSSSKGTEIQVVKYNEYQLVTNDVTNNQPTSNQQVTTNKNVKNIKNEKEYSNIESIDFDVLLKFINDSFDRKFRLINDKAKKQFKARLKNGYTKEDIKQCIVNLKSNTYHKESGYQYCTPEFISRQDTLDKYSSLKQQKENLSLQEQIIKNYKA